MFEELSNDKAYLLGFICADGHLSEYMLEMQIQEGDFYLLKEFDYLFNQTEYNFTLQERSKKIFCLDETWHYYSRLRVYGKPLIKELNSLGIPNNKTFGLKQVSIPDTYMPDFIRGFFDGDGSIHERRKNLEVEFVCASEDFLDWINLWISQNLNITLKNLSCRKNLYKLSYYSNDSIKLCKALYNTSSNLCLNRKKATYTNFNFVPSPIFWTKNQIEYLKTNYKPNTEGSLQTIADEIGKSYKAVSKKVWSLNLSNKA